jgi:hypothetical protein
MSEAMSSPGRTASVGRARASRAHEVVVAGVARCETMAFELSGELGHEDHVAAAGVSLQASPCAVASHLKPNAQLVAREVHVTS